MFDPTLIIGAITLITRISEALGRAHAGIMTAADRELFKATTELAARQGLADATGHGSEIGELPADQD